MCQMLLRCSNPSNQVLPLDLMDVYRPLGSSLNRLLGVGIALELRRPPPSKYKKFIKHQEVQL